MPKTVLGLVGPIASGKGAVLEILRNKGYASYSLSDRIREEIKARNDEITRESLNRVSNELREREGTNVLARRTAEIIERDNPINVVIDSIRNPAEVDYLKQRFNAKIIGVVADQRRRFEMFIARGANTGGVTTWEQFRELDDRELAQAGDHKQQVRRCIELSGIVIENDGTVEDLKGKVELAFTNLAQTKF